MKINRRDSAFVIPALLVMLVGLVVLASALWPFRPYKLYDYSVHPKVVCPGEVVKVHLSRHLDKGLYLLEVDAEWYEIGTNKFIELPDGKYKAVGTGKDEINTVSPLLRVSPMKSGKWVFKATVVAHGRVGVLPRTQIVTEDGDKPITVLPRSDKECKV